MRRNFDPRFRSLSALGGYFVQLPVFLDQQRCPLSVSRRLKIHYIIYYGKSNRCHDMSPLYGGYPLLGESVMGGFTVVQCCNREAAALSRFDVA